MDAPVVGGIIAKDSINVPGYRKTAMLVAMKYTKRWLFSGEFEGETYEKAYFGDFEVYDVALKETNVELDVVAGE